MNNNKKIGLLLAYKNTNYGAQLQAWATQRIVESFGFDTEIIEYRSRYPLDSLNFDRGVIRYLFISYKNKKLRTKVRKSDITDKLYNENKSSRERIYKDFIKRNLHNIKQYVGKKQLLDGVRDYSAVIIGSDQKWLPGACFSLLSSMRFVPKGIRRISYATSLGVSEYPKYCWSSSRKMWKSIDFLSVRESQGANIIKQICGDIPVSEVIDPTYLLTAKEWEQIVPSKRLLDKKYMFCYFLGNDDESKKCAQRYAVENHLFLVSILSNESLSKIDNSYADKIVTNSTPEDFINWIRGAEVVFTDSFHGLAFSVINKKQFYVFYRRRDDALLSRSSRIDNIISLWGISDRLIKLPSVTIPSLHENDIDYKEVEKVISEQRAKSISFLKKALTF